MKNIFANKKLLLVLIVVLIGAGIGGAVLYKYKIQKPPTPLISPEAVKAKCLADVSEMNEEQLIEKINTLAFVTGEESKKINDLMVKYLACNLRLNPTEENYNKTKENILKIKMSDESRRLTIVGIETIYPDLQRAKETLMMFPTLLATDEQESLCPDNKPVLQLKETCLAGAQKSLSGSIKSEFCNTLCERLDAYSKNPKIFEEEILNFTNWFQLTKDWNDYSELRLRYAWRMAVAFRFGGEEAALKVCGNLPSIKAMRDDCVSLIESYKELKEQKINCGNIFKELTAMICLPR